MCTSIILITRWLWAILLPIDVKFKTCPMYQSHNTKKQETFAELYKLGHVATKYKFQQKATPQNEDFFV